MNTSNFTRLIDSPLRDAWPNEAQDFTPWLFENIDFLSEAIGIELEAIEVEAAVESFAADIIAKDARTGDRILIENQLESSDHKHLGQVLTYLAGVEAKSVIWIAREFHEAHRSAIRWLNVHTNEDFAFFAVRVRAVRIGNSPFAPVFEVVEQPNSWERRISREAKASESELSKLRERFWNRYLQKYPGRFSPTRTSNIWLEMPPNGELILSMFVASKTCGMFLRGRRSGESTKSVEAVISEYSQSLDDALGDEVTHRPGKYFYITSTDASIRDEANWDEMIDWMDAQRQRYTDALDSSAAEGS